MNRIKTDLLIIGGGINGSGIAADAAGRGLSVVLCEQKDLANETSSASTKLIHGGLRYLEHYAFKLVRESLIERSILTRNAPHLIKPMKFILPHSPQLRSKWLIRLGLFLYDHLAKQSFKPSRKVSFENTTYGEPLTKQYKTGFSYYDCKTDDARLVIENCLQAKTHGATILNYTKFNMAKRSTDHWLASLQQVDKTIEVAAKVIVNASGPWVTHTLKNDLHITNEKAIHLIKGSHIIVPKLYQGDHAYILQNTDERIIFTIPYLDDFTLIGTTDIAIENYHTAKVEPSEIDYLCKCVNNYFYKKISPASVVHSFWGARTLCDDQLKVANKLSRQYELSLNTDNNQAPLLSVLSGKLTIYRKLAETALTMLQPYLTTMGPAWTAHTALPGAQFENGSYSNFCQQFAKDFSWLPKNLQLRYINTYGYLCLNFLKNKQSVNDLGQHIGAGLYTAEIDYLINHEWARTVEDILWRRTKLGLSVDNETAQRLKTFLHNK